MNTTDKDIEKKKKDIAALDQIMHFATSLQDQLIRYNARQSSFDALYGMDNIVAQVWIIARNVRNKLEEEGEE
jgi:hypothetical protein